VYFPSPESFVVSPFAKMKTVELKLSLTRNQILRLEGWLQKMNWVHNSALAVIESFNNHNRYLTRDKRSYACNPIVSHWRGAVYPSCPVKHQLDQFAPETYGAALDNPKDKKGTVYPLQAWAGEPVVKNLTYFSLLNRFAKKLHPVWLADIPQNFTSGRVERVALSWQAFLKGNAKPPKFKNRRNPVTTLIHNNSKAIKVEGDRINIPLMGWVKAKGLSKRWPQGVPFCPMKIVKAADGWYLQLTGNVGDARSVKPTGKTAGIDPGSKRHHTLDNGSFVQPPRYLLKSAEKLRFLQRKLSNQLRRNGVQVFDKNGRTIRWEFREGWERKNFDKTKAEIAKLHQRIARQRKALNHHLSSKYVAMFDAIALEDTKLTNMTRAVKKGEAGVPNGRKAKSGLNRNLLDNAIGQFYAMLEQKAKASGREIIRVEPQYTSQTCNHCGYRSSGNRKSQSKFVCNHCGHIDNADTNAAKNIKRMMVLGISRLTFTDNMADGWDATTLPETTKQPNPVEVVDPKPRKRSSRSGIGSKPKSKRKGGGCRKAGAEPVAQLDLLW
jgi:IS605 OrfB family transposase